jgi:hypothetical protein
MWPEGPVSGGSLKPARVKRIFQCDRRRRRAKKRVLHIEPRPSRLSSGSFAKLTAMRRASSLVSRGQEGLDALVHRVSRLASP